MQVYRRAAPSKNSAAVSLYTPGCSVRGTDSMTLRRASPEPRPLYPECTSVLTTSVGHQAIVLPRLSPEGLSTGRRLTLPTTRPPWALQLDQNFPKRRQIVRTYPGKVHPRGIFHFDNVGTESIGMALRILVCKFQLKVCCSEND